MKIKALICILAKLIIISLLIHIQMNFIKEIDYYPELEDDIKSLVENNKVLVIKKLPLDLNYEEYYKKIAQKIGFFIYADENYKTGEITPNVWTRVVYDKDKLHDTYKHSNLAQPMHTDYCYVPILDIVMLICENPAPVGGATTFIDANVVYKLLKIYNSDLLEKVLSTDIIFGKGDNPITTNKVAILKEEEGNYILNWSRFRISDKNDSFAKDIVKDFDYFITNYIEKMGVATNIYLQNRDAAFIRDEYVLHGRNSFLGDRCLLKGAIAYKHKKEATNVLSKIIN